jgi:L-ribulose-5-phosphate 3-epimerase
MPRIAIMQGRLSPPEPDHFQAFPRSGWEDEFAKAQAAGLGAIEWIYDVYGEDVNPLASDEGIRRMEGLAAATGVAVESVCADWFMEHLLAGGGDALKRLRWLIGRCELAGIGRIVLPFVDASRLADDAQRAAAGEALGAALPEAERSGVELHLETDLGPEEFAAFLERLPSAAVRVNYDSGNSSSLGYDPHEEFAAYGERIGSFHVKDRVRGGGTVPLGEGDADLPTTFRLLREAGYERDIVLQVARSEPGNEVDWARHNRELVERLWG